MMMQQQQCAHAVRECDPKSQRLFNGHVLHVVVHTVELG